MDIERNNTVVGCRNGPSFKFKEVFRESDDLTKIQKSCLEPLIRATINGFNTSLLLFGEAESGKSHVLWGSDRSRAGLFSFTMSDIFNNLEINERFRSSFKVRMRMFNVFENSIVDLIRINNSARLNANNVDYSANTGYDIKDLTTVEVTSGAQAVVIFTDAWNQRVSLERNDTYLQGSVIVQIKLILKDFEEKHKSTVSQLTIAYLPGDEGSGLMPLERLLTKLNGRDIGYVNYAESLITRLLEDEIGGNCMTNAILFITNNPNTNALTSQIKMMTNLAVVENCPIVNTDLARRLLFNLRQQRKELALELNPDNKMQPHHIRLNKLSLMDNIKLTQKENVMLRDKVEELQSRLDRTNYRFENAMRDVTFKNDDFIHIEEGKLKSSKRIIDLEIINNKLREQVENIRFELQNKILHLEEKLTQSELTKQVTSLQSKEFKKLKEERDQLSEQVSALQTSLTSLQNKLRFMMAKNDELNLEFINLSNNKKKKVLYQRLNDLDPMFGLPAIQASRVSGHQTKISSPNGITTDNDLKFRLGHLQDELQKFRNIAQEKLRQFSETTAELVVLREENKQLKSEVAYFNKYSDEIALNYQQQLKKYATNIVNLMTYNSTNEISYKEEFNSLLNKYNESHLLREHKLKETINDLITKQEELKSWGERVLVQYILIREQLLQNNINGLDIGPDPKDILKNHPSPNEKIQALSIYMNKGSKKNDFGKSLEIQHQLKEFGNAHVSNLEIERAQLLARNVELEEQLIASQKYIDFSLKKKLANNSKP